MTKWGKLDGEDAEAIVEILAEADGFDFGGDVAICRGDNADVHGAGSVWTEFRELAFLKGTKRERKGFHALAEDCGFDVLRGDQSLPQTVLRVRRVAGSSFVIQHGSAITGHPTRWETLARPETHSRPGDRVPCDVVK